ncbi:MAG: hypothetical protein J7483_11025 [Novosphingobium sp.]|nr:hypothetical protein [Novosphingobium sp.]
MKILFDSSTIAFSQYLELIFPAVAALIAFVMAARGARRRWVIGMAALSLFLFALVFLLPLADHMHVQAAAKGPDIKTIEGVISDHSRVTERRFTGTSSGVGVTTTHNYRTVTTESFHVGPVWFWFDVNGFPSAASFTNAGDQPWRLANGQHVRISYFEDSWYQGQRRITRIAASEARWQAGAVVDPKMKAVGGDKPADPGFDAFWQRFSAAASKGDAAGVKALTRFPFLFAGTPLDAGRFDSIWMGIFPAPNRPCFAAATPARDGDAMSVSCGVYVYVFEKGADGWKLASFTADPEAEQ